MLATGPSYRMIDFVSFRSITKASLLTFPVYILRLLLLWAEEKTFNILCINSIYCKKIFKLLIVVIFQQKEHLCFYRCYRGFSLAYSCPTIIFYCLCMYLVCFLKKYLIKRSRVLDIIQNRLNEYHFCTILFSILIKTFKNIVLNCEKYFKLMWPFIENPCLIQLHCLHNREAFYSS